MIQVQKQYGTIKQNMRLYNREDAIQHMNRLAKENKDFVFIINYEANGAYVDFRYRPYGVIMFLSLF